MSGSVRSAVVRISADVSGLIAAYSKAKVATEDLAKSSLNFAAQHQKAINDVGRSAGLMGAAAAGGLLLAVKTAADFDAKMSEVKAATQDGAKGMADLRAAAIQAGAATVFSAGDAADGITNLAKAGISTADILNGGLKGALALASAGQIDVASAAEDTATALTQFNLKGSAASHVADLLSAGANKAQGDVTDLAYALNYAGLPAHALGVSINQTVGTLALFAKNGLIGSQAGTSLRGVLSSLTSPSKQAAAEMKTLGISVFDAHGKFIGLDGVAQQLHDHMGKLTQEERANALGRIFGNQQLQAANILYKNGAAGVDEWTKKVNDSGNAVRTAATKMDNLKGDIEQLSGSLQTALIGTGEGAQSPLRGLVQDLTKVVNAYIALGPAAQSGIAKVLGATALLGGSVWAVSKVINTVTNVRSTFADLSSGLSSANKTMLAMRGAAFAAGAGLEVLGHSISDSHHTLGTLTEAAGGAAMGFAVGGPWGAAIGGGISLLASLAGAAGNAAGQEAALTATLNQQTGAITGNTRQWVAHKLETDGVLANAQQLGLDMSTVTKAAMGNSSAMSYLNRVLRQYEAAARGKGGTSPEYQRVKDMQALIAAMKSQTDQIHNVVAARRREIQASETAQSVMKGLAQTYQLTPKQVRTVIEQQNMGKSQADIAQLLHQYGLTPKQVQTFLKAVDNASPVLQRVGGELSGLNGKTATTYVVTHYSKTYGGQAGGGGHVAPGLTYAAGGVLDFYANGGMREHHVAQIAPAGAMRIWAEPETGGEAYIPLAAAKRDRSRAIAAEVVSRLGGQARFANGGINAPVNAVRTYAAGGGRSGPLEMECTFSIPELGVKRIRATMYEVGRQAARQEIDDNDSFHQAMTGRGR